MTSSAVNVLLIEPMRYWVSGSGAAPSTRPRPPDQGRAPARAREKADQDYAMTVAGIGEFAVKSWHLGGEHEIEVMLADGPAGPALQRAASTGEPIASVVIRRAGHTVTLTDVLVTRF